MRLLMMGTGPFAVPTFEALLNSEDQVVALVTRPVPPARGRRKGATNPMRDVAEARGVRILDPADVNDEASRAAISELAPDLMVVCDYGQILSRRTLAIAPLGGINLHGSLLPEYRGAAPVHWAIWDGKTETGVTVIHMTPKLDAGPCLSQRKTKIEPRETTADLEPRLAKLGVEPVQQAIRMLAGWDGQSSIGQLQDVALASKAPRLQKSDGQVDWSQPAIRIANQVRALKPWPGTFTQWTDSKGEPKRLILDSVNAVRDAPLAQPGNGANSAAVAGEVISVDGQHLIIATGDGALSIERVQPAGKRAMDIAEFLRGHAISMGDRFE